MKKLITLVLLGLISLSFAQAQDLDLPEAMIEREVSVKELADLEVRSGMLREDFKHEVSLLDDTTDPVEGKIRAAMINSILQSLNKAQTEMDAIQSDFDLTREAIDSIKKELDLAEALIKELNV
jgi:hypothetical protein